MAERSIQLESRMLGLEPYILITITGADDDGLDFGIDYGGGITLETEQEKETFVEVLRTVADLIEEGE